MKRKTAPLGRPGLYGKRLTMAAFGYAASAWFADPAAGLGAHLTRAFDELHGLSSTVGVLGASTFRRDTEGKARP